MYQMIKVSWRYLECSLVSLAVVWFYCGLLFLVYLT